MVPVTINTIKSMQLPSSLLAWFTHSCTSHSNSVERCGTNFDGCTARLSSAQAPLVVRRCFRDACDGLLYYRPRVFMDRSRYRRYIHIHISHLTQSHLICYIGIGTRREHHPYPLGLTTYWILNTMLISVVWYVATILNNYRPANLNP